MIVKFICKCNDPGITKTERKIKSYYMRTYLLKQYVIDTVLVKQIKNQEGKKAFLIIGDKWGRDRGKFD